MAFDVDGLEAAPIREDLEYGGVRVRTQATIAGARIPIQVDVGFGDAITPGPIEIDYPALLDAPTPRVRAYPIETVVAEKFHALATRGITNSRLKDYYDLYRRDVRAGEDAPGRGRPSDLRAARDHASAGAADRIQ